MSALIRTANLSAEQALSRRLLCPSTRTSAILDTTRRRLLSSRVASQNLGVHSGKRHVLTRLVQPISPVTSWSIAPLLGSTAGMLVSRSQCEHAIVHYPTRNVQKTLPKATTKTTWRELRAKARRAWRMLVRFLKLSLTLAPVTLFYPFLSLTSVKKEDEDAQDLVLAVNNEEALGGFLGWYLRMCLACVERSGAAVIKLMQWAGSRPDLFGREFCSVFSQLQDNTTPHGWKHTVKVLKEAFGDNWEEKIRLHEIVGSGCIGQVYSGEIVDQKDGSLRKVAVKVLHPNVEEDIDADLDLMRFAVRAVQWLPFDVFANLKWLNMEGVVEEFADLLKTQLDLKNEASHLVRFNENFEGDETVVFPKLVPGFDPTTNVLVETFCEGVPVLQFARENREDGEKLYNMCVAAIKAVCKMIFLDNFMHGDLHPGNVFVSRDGKNFILFDVGIVAEYSDHDHQALVDILSAFIRKQGRKAGRLMIDDSNNRLVASQSGDRARDEELYIDKIEALTIRARSKDYFMERLGTYISYICNAAAQHHILMNPTFVSAALAVKVEEGIALALDPSVEITRVAIPIIVESERRRFTSSAKEKFTGGRNLLERFFGGKS